MMAKQRLIGVMIAVFALVVFTGTTLSRRRTPPTLPGPENLRDLADPEESEVMRKLVEARRLQERISKHEYLAAMMKQALKNELRASETQWRSIEPRYERQIQLMLDSSARASHRITTGKDLWIKSTEDKGAGWALPKTAVEVTEAERNVDELIDLLRQDDTSDEELRKQINALQQAREKARGELPKAKQELAAALTTARQEAVFLLLGHID